MAKIDHSPEFKPDDPQKDWGIDVGRHDSNKAKLSNAEENPNKINDNDDSLSNLENDSTYQDSRDDADWDNNVTGDENVTRVARFANFLKKRGPIGLVLGILLSGGAIGIMYLTPAMVAFQFIESLTNFSDDSASSLRIRTNKLMQNKIKNSFAESSDEKCNIQCKFGSVNEDFIKKLKAKGFEVDSTKKSFGRFVINSITFPDGTKVNNGEEFKNALKDTPKLSSFNNVFNIRSSFFLNKYFSIDTLKNKFKIDKTAKLKSSSEKKEGEDVDIKESVKQSLRESLGLPKTGVNNIKDTAIYKDVTAKIEKLKLSKKVNYLNLPSIMCSVYDISKGITFAVKTAKIASVAAIVMIMFNAIDQTKAGESDENIMSVVGDMLTQTDANGDTVTSSPGYRAATYYEPMILSKEDEKYSITTSPAVNTAIGALTSIVSVGGIIGIVNMSKMCAIMEKVGDNPILNALIDCPGEIAAALATSIETLGIGTILSLVKCAIKVVGIPALVSLAVSNLFGSILNLIYNHELFTIDDKSKGASLGNALFSGGSQVLGGKAATYGMRPARNKSEIGNYMEATAVARQQQLAINTYDAKDTPFDVSNQYSFAGSIIKKLGIANLYKTSAVNNMNNLFTFLPKSLASLSNNTYAENNSKANLYDNKCADSAMKNIEIEATDALCNPSYIMENKALDIDPNDNISWMLFTQSIDQDGNTVPNSLYSKYSKYCVNRTDPLGETSVSISDPDYPWAVGLYCARESLPIEDPEFAKKMQLFFGESDIRLYHFRAYTMDLDINNTIDEPVSSGSSGGATADATIDVANLYNDSTSINCAAGTTDAGIQDGYTDGSLVKIRTCKIPGTLDNDENLSSPREATVNSRVSGAWLALINEMKTATGESTIGVASSFRTMAMQEADKAKYGSGAAAPGFSNHQMGLAIDFDTLYGSGSWGKGEKPYYDFLSYNGGGKKYGFNQIDGEAWHWEPIH